MTASTEKTTKKLRSLLKRPGVIRTVNVYDPLTARMAESLGFDGVALGGFQLGARLCVTEPALTMTEMIENARQITRAIKIPLKADCGTGFGDAIHVTRTVREAEAAGIACISIEDQVFPKRAHYHKGIEHVIPVGLMVEKIKAAVEARADPDFVLIGRTDAMRTDDVREGIRRGNLFAEAGCDMILIFPNTLEEAKLAAREINAPLIYANSPGNRLGRPILSWAQLEEFGYKMSMDGIAMIISAVRGVRETMQRYLKDGRPPDEIAENIEVRDWIESIIGLPEYYAIEERTTESRPAA